MPVLAREMMSPAVEFSFVSGVVCVGVPLLRLSVGIKEPPKLQPRQPLCSMSRYGKRFQGVQYVSDAGPHVRIMRFCSGRTPADAA